MSKPLRVVSLLPGLTDTVMALGCGESLVGVSHECDLPEGWPVLPRLTSTRINSDLPSEAIDAQVREQFGEPLYALDKQAIKELKPNLILTQAQCDVCAVSEMTVRQVADSLPGRPPVVSVNPTNLSGVFGMIRETGQALEKRQAAETIIRAFETAELSLDSQRAGQADVGVVHLEWLDPVMGSGHWNPEQVRLAGGLERTSLPGAASRVLPEHLILEAFQKTTRVILGICGFSIERTRTELNLLPEDHLLKRLLKESGSRVFAVDGHRLMVRPGPLLLTSLQTLATSIGRYNTAVFAKSLGSMNLEPRPSDLGELVHGPSGWLFRS